VPGIRAYEGTAPRALANADINVLEVHMTTTDARVAEIVIDTADNVSAIAAPEML